MQHDYVVILSVTRPLNGMLNVTANILETLKQEPGNTNSAVNTEKGFRGGGGRFHKEGCQEIKIV